MVSHLGKTVSHFVSHLGKMVSHPGRIVSQLVSARVPTRTVIKGYHNELVPLIVPMILIQHYVRKHHQHVCLNP